MIRSSLIEINIRKTINSVQKRIVTVFLDFKADLSYCMEIPTLLMDRKDDFLSNISCRKAKLVMFEASFGGRQFCLMFFFFLIVFNSKNHPFFEIDTTTCTGLYKQNLPHFLTQFWLESPPDPS